MGMLVAAMILKAMKVVNTESLISYMEWTLTDSDEYDPHSLKNLLRLLAF